jgi:hypothetical protein
MYQGEIGLRVNTIILAICTCALIGLMIIILYCLLVKKRHTARRELSGQPIFSSRGGCTIGRSESVDNLFLARERQIAQDKSRTSHHDCRRRHPGICQ